MLVPLLCASIGCFVAWMLALYTSRGFALLLGDTFYGMVGAALGAYAIALAAPAEWALPALVAMGPVFSLLMIFAMDAVRRSTGRLRW
jgi:hypothetical protein